MAKNMQDSQKQFFQSAGKLSIVFEPRLITLFGRFMYQMTGQTFVTQRIRNSALRSAEYGISKNRLRKRDGNTGSVGDFHGCLRFAAV